MLGGRLTPMVKAIIIGTIAFYIVEVLLVLWVLPWLGIPARVAFDQLHLGLVPAEVSQGMVWELVTFLLIHDLTNPLHVLLNMFGLWMFGGLLEERWGQGGFCRFYLLCGLGSGLAVMLWAHFVQPQVWTIPTIGASGPIFALVAAYGVVFRDRQVLFYFLLPLKAQHMVYLMIGMAVLWFLVRSDQSFSAHMGGLAAGYLLATGYWRPRTLGARLRLWRARRRQAKMKTIGGGNGGNGKGKWDVN